MALEIDSRVGPKPRSRSSWAAVLQLTVSLAVAGMALAFGGISLYYFSSLKDVDEGVVNALVQTPAILATFLFVVAALLAGSSLAFLHRRVSLGTALGTVGLLASGAYVFLSPWTVFIADNGDVADRGGLYFLALFLSLIIIVGLGLTSLVSLIVMLRQNIASNQGASYPRTPTSPDGLWWWNGQRWQPTRKQPPSDGPQHL